MPTNLVLLLEGAATESARAVGNMLAAEGSGVHTGGGIDEIPHEPGSATRRDAAIISGIRESDLLVEARKAHRAFPRAALILAVRRERIGEVRATIAREGDFGDRWHVVQDDPATLTELVRFTLCCMPTEEIGKRTDGIPHLSDIDRKRFEAELRRSRNELGVILEGIIDGVTTQDRNGRLIYANDAAARLTGYPSAETFLDAPIAEVMGRFIMMDESGAPISPSELPGRIAIQEARSVERVFRFRIVETGEERWAVVSAAPVLADDGTAILAINIFRDITEQRRASERMRFLAEASELLASSLDYETTLQSVSRLAVPTIAEWSAVDMLSPDGSVKRLAVSHADPERIELANELMRRFPADPDAQTGVPNVIRTGRVEFYPMITDEMLAFGARSPEELEMLRRIGFSSVIIVPLQVRGERIGAITFVQSAAGKHFDAGDLELAIDLGRRASVAVENARLHRLTREQKEWFEVTLSSIGDAVIATDTAGNITFMNPVAEMMTGWRLSDALGERLDDVFRIVNERTNATVENPVVKVIESGGIVALANHTLLIARDGTVLPIDDSAAPIRDHQGTISGVVLVFHDVTQRHKAEQERAELLEREREARAEVEASEERYRWLAEAMPEIVWTATPDGVTDYLNQRWYDYTGISMNEGTGFDRTGVIHPDDMQGRLDRWAVSMRQGTVFEFECRFRRQADGSYRWHLLRAIPIRDDQGNITQWIGTSTDIDDQKRTEEELTHARERAEAASNAKDHFLAVLSHELRTPLTPVLTAAQLLMDEPGLSPGVRDYMEVIHRNIELEARLIDDLLDLTRIERGKLQLNFTVVDAHALIRNVMQIYQNDFHDKHLHAIVELDAPRHHARADSARLQQIIWNLVQNAVKFTPHGGTVTIRTSNEGEGVLRIDVIDTGIGIDQDVLPRIFNAFEQGERKVTRRFGGLGLGLAISRALADMHSGSLEASSEGQDRGSTLIVRIPVESVKEPAHQGLSESLPVRILLVDDHADTVHVMGMLLRRHGYRVATAGTMRSGMEAAVDGEYDLLISDIGLPDGSGLELMREIRSRGILIKGIALSGFGMEEDIRQSREAGFSEHLTKPVDFRKLQEVILRVLQ
ncbi:MAG: domain S-box-containing protein [Chlorobi bacterium]|nr:domain S-box-containing protein [Chlorobiota bacterium]